MVRLFKNLNLQPAGADVLQVGEGYFDGPLMHYRAKNLLVQFSIQVGILPHMKLSRVHVQKFLSILNVSEPPNW